MRCYCFPALAAKKGTEKEEKLRKLKDEMAKRQEQISRYQSNCLN
jgi:hypothetical protein